MKKLTLAVGAVLCLSGCVSTVVESGGVKFSTHRFLWPGTIAEARLTTTNGESISITGYNSEVNKLVEAVAAGVTQGAIKAAK